MNTINALQLSKATAEDFSNWLDDSEEIGIAFFGNVIALVSRELEHEPETEISLPALCRKSKQQLKQDLKRVKQMKVVSGQHNKKVVAYITKA